VLLNFFDVDTAAGERSVELQVGDLPQLGLQADLLVVSAFEGCYAPVPGTLLGGLHEAYGLKLSELEIALDLRSSPLKAWISGPLHWGEQGSSLVGLVSQFKRIAVVEGAIEWQEGDLVPWPPFNRLFSLLALLPLRGIACSVVASPLLGSGKQGIEAVSHFPELLEAYRAAFRYLPDLQRLIIFDKTEQHLSILGAAIDAALARPDPQDLRINLPTILPGLERLDGLLLDRVAPRKEHSSALAHDLSELLEILRAGQIAPIALGIHARRVVEQLVLHSLRDVPTERRLNLAGGIRMLRQRGANRWLTSCLDQVREFGNWMGHPQETAHQRPVQLCDVLAVLTALQRVLEDYPWRV
jgi:hypothetical protein